MAQAGGGNRIWDGCVSGGSMGTSRQVVTRQHVKQGDSITRFTRSVIIAKM